MNDLIPPGGDLAKVDGVTRDIDPVTAAVFDRAGYLDHADGAGVPCWAAADFDGCILVNHTPYLFELASRACRNLAGKAISTPSAGIAPPQRARNDRQSFCMACVVRAAL